LLPSSGHPFPVCPLLAKRPGQRKHAPGDKFPQAEVLRVAHHALLAHGRAVQALRANAKARPRIGFAPFSSLYVPASSKKADIEAARRATFGFTRPTLWIHSWWNVAGVGRRSRTHHRLVGASCCFFAERDDPDVVWPACDCAAVFRHSVLCSLAIRKQIEIGFAFRASDRGRSCTERFATARALEVDASASVDRDRHSLSSFRFSAPTRRRDP
jgi:hypothetical protein